MISKLPPLHALWRVANIADAENALFSIHALAPEGKDLVAHVQGELRGKRAQPRLGGNPPIPHEKHSTKISLKT